MNTDVTLCRIVHRENPTERFYLTAMLTRFGGLAVFVADLHADVDKLMVYQGDNIITAREWCLAQ